MLLKDKTQDFKSEKNEMIFISPPLFFVVKRRGKNNESDAVKRILFCTVCSANRVGFSPVISMCCKNGFLCERTDLVPATC